jgi:hypothetical protein
VISVTIPIASCARMGAMKNTTSTKRSDAIRDGHHEAIACTNSLATLTRDEKITVAYAQELVGGLSNPSKMPSKSYSTPAAKCNVGSKLRDVSGSTCSDCYACKGCYEFTSTIQATTRRYYVLLGCMSSEFLASQWAYAMSIAIGRKPHFRWHDAGDLLSIQHLTAIVHVANLRPDVSFWLPTREYKIVREYTRVYGEFPANLIVRVSAAMRDDDGPQIEDGSGLINLDESTGYLPTSGVHDMCSPIGHACDAYTRDGECGDCRVCWDRETAHVSYPRH